MRRSALCLALLAAISAHSLRADQQAAVEFLSSGKVLPRNLPFSEAVRHGTTLYLSGQIGVLPGTLELVPGGIEEESRQTMENIKATLEAHGHSMADLVKCTVMLADISEWSVFNDVYKTYFSGRYPARSALGVTGLALDARVEVECIAAVDEVEEEQQRLLAIHEGFKEAHLRSDAEAVLRPLADEYARVNRGEVHYSAPEDMAARMRSYLGRTRFTEYRDLRPPIVKVSEDGTLGWVIVQLQARGVQTDASGNEQPLEFVCAWISLFEKRNGAWVNTGDVSTFKE